MRSFLFSFLILFLFTYKSISQVVSSEALSLFLDEIPEVLYNTNKKITQKIRINIKAYENGEKKPYENETIVFIFLNDSVYQQKMQLSSYFGVLRGKETFEYDPKKNEIIKPETVIERDSSGFKIYTYMSKQKKDSVIRKEISRSGPNGETIERFTYLKKEFFYHLWNGDSLMIYKSYERTSIGDKIKYEGRVYSLISKNNLIKTDSSIVTNYKISNDPITFTNVTRTYRTMDINNRIIQSKKSVSGNEPFLNYCVMTIEYIEKRK